MTNFFKKLLLNNFVDGGNRRDSCGKTSEARPHREERPRRLARSPAERELIPSIFNRKNYRASKKEIFSVSYIHVLIYNLLKLAGEVHG
jgi:hypothetical protein